MSDAAARDVELHEAAAWAACVEAAAEAIGNPLEAGVDRSHGIAVPMLRAVDFGLFNRVIGLGVGAPVADEVLDAVVASYTQHGLDRFVVEVTPGTEADVAPRLAARGLADSGHRQVKVVQEPVRYEGPGMDAVVELGPDDVDEVAQVNMIAWEVPAFLAVWFGAPLFAEHFRHFGVRVDGRIVSTGAMYVTDGLAWLGFGATLPEHRGRGMQKALLARRVHEAAVLGCRLVHSETAAHTAQVRNPSLDNLLATGFEHVHDKQWWSYPPRAQG